ncbi:hypothetical protein EDB19DRAFT_1636070 [Suillus lakei]|nr:hypothetical protein EDB19DRAFT_1636070 [Suillus lakei]
MKTIDISALLDCGAGEVFIDFLFCKQNCIPLIRLPLPIEVSNTDASLNCEGLIKFKVELYI